jgi:hypothetical protein
MKPIITVLLSFFLAGCATSGYRQFYQSYGGVTQLKDIDITFLPEGGEPELYQVNTKEVDAAVRRLRSKGYLPIGYSSFNGAYEDIANAKAQAKRLKAFAVIVGVEYTDTQTSTIPLSMPTSQTTYGSGMVSAGGAHGTYSGSSTTYGSTIVPVTTQQRRYDQNAVFLAKDNRKARFGLCCSDLESKQRQALGRNTGSVVDVVIEKTPAFYANIIEGDVIIAIDGVPVRSAAEGYAAMNNVPKQATSSTLTIIRGGKELSIEVQF